MVQPNPIQSNPIQSSSISIKILEKWLVLITPLASYHQKPSFMAKKKSMRMRIEAPLSYQLRYATQRNHSFQITQALPVLPPTPRLSLYLLCSALLCCGCGSFAAEPGR
ncbi:hypothetical protein V6N11_040848 [Hibiscus sabdariffa]|uniref:Uncharacterized protein n=1 Tax=Hibiscus sabdariffa TaxID=183260 RepID=A0ABR2RIW5_9ROSI